MTTTKILPAQKKGSHTGASSKMDCYTRHQAIVIFGEAKQRLLDINDWHRLSGKDSALFQLTDKNGNELNSSDPVKGDLIRIKLPAPRNSSGDGFDWVEIEAFEESKDLVKDEDRFGFRVRPVQNPKADGEQVAHFYTKDASSTFLIIRDGSMVTVMEKGRNEQPNAKAPTLLNKLRNLLVAIPAMIGLSEPQWKSLVEGVLKGPKI